MRIILSLILSMLVFTAPARASDELKIVAIVGSDVVTNLDVINRMNVLLDSIGGNVDINYSVLEQQIVKDLVNEIIKEQAARKSGILVSEREVEQAIENLEKASGSQPGDLRRKFSVKNLSYDSFKQRIRSDISWTKLVLRKLRRGVVVTQSDIDRVRRNSTDDNVEVKTAAIEISFGKGRREEDARKLALQIKSLLDQGAPFDAVKAQLAGDNPDFDADKWVLLSSLEPSVIVEVLNMSVGQISALIKTVKSYKIIKLKDRRKIDIDIKEVKLNLKRVLMKLDGNATDTEVQLLIDISKQMRLNPGNCGDGLAGIQNVEELGFMVEDIQTSMAEISTEIQPFIQNLALGEVSEAFATPEGIQFLMLCGRKEDKATDIDERIRQAIFQQKLQREAEKYLSKLQRDTFIQFPK